MKPQLTSQKIAEPVEHRPTVIDAEPVAGPALDADPSKPGRLGILILVIGFGGFLLWSIFAPLDAGVPAQGTVSVESQRKTIQHLSGGVVDQILVHEGEEVREGQVLITLTPGQAQANLGFVRAQYLAALAVKDRLMAEYQNLNAIKFDPYLIKAIGDANIKEVMGVQQTLFATRRASQRKEAAILRDSAAALEPQLSGMRELAADGYVPRNKMLDTERAYAEIRLRILQQEQEYRKQVETQLGDAQKEVSALYDRLRAAEEELARTKVTAPVSGYVVSLATNTVGGVVPPGGRMLDIVPKGEPLIVEAQIPVYLIDQIRTQKGADLRFTVLDQKRSPVLAGKVLTVSADRLTDPATHMPYYLVRISVPIEELKRLDLNRVHPGMPVDVILKGEPRTLIDYLLKPLTDRYATAFKER